jgi:DNA-binding IclR family transcriptional regulator
MDSSADTHIMEEKGESNTFDGVSGWARYVENIAPQGAQGTVRIAALLRIVAAHNTAGMRLQEIARLAGLEQSTAHRIVSALHSVGFLSREPNSRRYHLGPLLFELFTTAFPHFNIRDVCLPAMKRLAEGLGDTVYLSVRSGFDGICIERSEGSYPIRTCTVEVGVGPP